MFDFHDDFSRCILSLGVNVCQSTAYHLGDDIVGGKLIRRPGTYISTITHDRNVICDPFDLVHLV